METSPGSQEQKADDDRALGSLRRPELIPGLLGVAAFLVLAVSQGGSQITGWAPAGLFMIGLAIAVSIALRPRVRELGAPALWAIGLLGAFVLWSFASIAWAEVEATAWDGANRALVYLVVYATFSLIAWRARSAALVVGVYAAGLAVAGAVVLVDAAGSPEAALFLVNGRLAEPTGYANAVAALFIGGFWPAVHLASRREVPSALRGPLLGIAGFLIQIALMPQSRASLLIMPLALIIYVLVVPDRLRAAIYLGLALAATALVASPVLDVFATADEGGDMGSAFSDAAGAMLLSFVGLTIVGTAIAVADRRISIGASATRTASRVVGAVAGLLAVGALAVAVVEVGDPIGWADERWEDFKGDYDEEGFGSSRFSGDLGSGRYDFWRVALEDGFASAPLAGQGSDNFAVTYLEHRETGEEPLYPHSFPVRLLAGSGIVGTLLFAGFFVAAIVAAFRTRARQADPLARAVAGIALAAAAYYFLHASGDWLWTFAGITLPVMAWLGIAGGGLRGEQRTRVAETQREIPRIVPIGLATLLTVAAAASLTFPWLSARYTESAASSWQADSAKAYSRLETARGLNPLSARPDLVAGTIAVRDGNAEVALDAFARAAERDPSNWYALLEIGSLEIDAGRTKEGLIALRRARILNPAEPLIASALRRARGERPLTTAEIDQALLQRVCARVGATRDTRFCSTD